jgi:hypothetical protein
MRRAAQDTPATMPGSNDGPTPARKTNEPLLDVPSGEDPGCEIAFFCECGGPA